MYKAEQARIKTEAVIATKAREFIINDLSMQIQRAIDSGYFKAIVEIDQLPNTDIAGQYIIKILKDEYGYDAKYFSDGKAGSCRKVVEVNW